MIRSFDPFREFNYTAGSTLDFDLLQSEEGVQLFIDLPGVNPDEVDITVDGRSLHLKAERSFEVPEGTTLISRRRPSKSISRSFQLGENLDPEGLEADYAYGVLKVTVPVAESAKPRKISVGAGSEHNAVEAA